MPFLGSARVKLIFPGVRPLSEGESVARKEGSFGDDTAGEDALADVVPEGPKRWLPCGGRAQPRTWRWKALWSCQSTGGKASEFIVN